MMFEYFATFNILIKMLTNNLFYLLIFNNHTELVKYKKLNKKRFFYTFIINQRRNFVITRYKNVHIFKDKTVSKNNLS